MSLLALLSFALLASTNNECGSTREMTIRTSSIAITDFNTRILERYEISFALRTYVNGLYQSWFLNVATLFEVLGECLLCFCHCYNPYRLLATLAFYQIDVHSCHIFLYFQNWFCFASCVYFIFLSFVHNCFTVIPNFCFLSSVHNSPFKYSYFICPLRD